ncbi:hypothetical protein [Terasakiella sp. SH-1]|uniref:hypothetical protein n=1 Tax=Terasakiella sp. SH-1 TaxID=2560057 RepID=UPI0010732045|nr:hypothetical protein [Terasakiella sp. SH-1]
MTSLMNNSFFLSLLFPAVTVLGTLPLLRWAIGGEKRDVFASLSLGLGCFIAVMIAFGRVEEPFQFGMKALPYGLGFASFMGLLLCLISQTTIRLIGMLVTVVIWGWILCGMSLDLAILIKTAFAGLVLYLFSFVLALKARNELAQAHQALDAFLPLSMISFTLFLFAKGSGDQMAQNFAIALCVIGISAMVWCVPKLQFTFHENAVLPYSLAIGALAWDMWLQGHAPLISLLCLCLVLFSRQSVEKIVDGRSHLIVRAKYAIYVIVGALPAFLSLVFYDVLRAL